MKNEQQILNKLNTYSYELFGVDEFGGALTKYQQLEVLKLMIENKVI